MKINISLKRKIGLLCQTQTNTKKQRQNCFYFPNLLYCGVSFSSNSLRHLTLIIAHLLACLPWAVVHTEGAGTSGPSCVQPQPSCFSTREGACRLPKGMKPRTNIFIFTGSVSTQTSESPSNCAVLAIAVSYEIPEDTLLAGRLDPLRVGIGGARRESVPGKTSCVGVWDSLGNGSLSGSEIQKLLVEMRTTVLLSSIAASEVWAGLSMEWPLECLEYARA